MAIAVLALLALLVAAALLAGLRRAVLAVILVRPSCDLAFEWIKTLGGGTTGPGAAVNGLVIALAAAGVAHRPGILLAPPVVASMAFTGAAMAALVMSPDPSSGVRLILTLVTFTAVGILPFAIIRDGRTALACLVAALLSSVVPAGAAILELVLRPDILFGAERLHGTFMHPNIFAFYLVGVATLALFLASSTMVTPSRTTKAILFGWLLVILVLLLATKTRSAWIGMALVLAAHALLNDRRWLALAPLASAGLFIPGVGERILDLASGTTDDAFATLNSFAWRQLLWADTLTWLETRPPGLFGHGPDLYAAYVPLFFVRLADLSGIGAHNTLLQVWFEMGLVGIAAYAALMGSMFVEAVRRFPLDPPGAILIAALGCAHLVFSYTDNVLDYLQYQWFLWFLVGTVAASTRVFPQAATGQGKSAASLAASRLAS